MRAVKFDFRSRLVLHQFYGAHQRQHFSNFFRRGTRGRLGQSSDQSFSTKGSLLDVCFRSRVTPGQFQIPLEALPHSGNHSILNERSRFALTADDQSNLQREEKSVFKRSRHSLPVYCRSLALVVHCARKRQMERASPDKGPRKAAARGEVREWEASAGEKVTQWSQQIEAHVTSDVDVDSKPVVSARAAHLCVCAKRREASFTEVCRIRNRRQRQRQRQRQRRRRRRRNDRRKAKGKALALALA